MLGAAIEDFQPMFVLLTAEAAGKRLRSAVPPPHTVLLPVAAQHPQCRGLSSSSAPMAVRLAETLQNSTVTQMANFSDGCPKCVWEWVGLGCRAGFLGWVVGLSCRAGLLG